MLKRIKQAIVTTIAAAALLFPLAVPVMVHAAAATTPSIQSSLCGGTDLSINATSDCAKSNTDAETNANNLIAKIINVFSAVVGIVAVIMIVVGGFKYITSGGNDSNVSGAKNTILYAVIGLVIVALAQVIVKYVLSKTLTA
jgi:hypothetical protein